MGQIPVKRVYHWLQHTIVKNLHYSDISVGFYSNDFGISLSQINLHEA